MSSPSGNDDSADKREGSDDSAGGAGDESWTDDDGDGPATREDASNRTTEQTTAQEETAAADPRADDDHRERPRVGNRSSGPPPTADPDPDDGNEQEPLLKEIVISVVAVLLVGVYIFMVSGVWPPMVAVESGSMEPNMNVNDLVFVMESDRFQPEQAQGDTGVVTAQEGQETGYEQFGGPGDVIVFNPNGNEGRTPIIHRAMFWVEDGERWVDRANPEYLGGADSCEEVAACPATNAGFITKGDNNPSYDQVGGGRFRTGPSGNDGFRPVRPEWVVGTAEVRVPRIGWLRLRFQ